jgi:hypothetical protein
MKALETGFDIVVALVKGGVGAAWELIKEKLTNLKDMVIDGIVGFVTDTIIKKAIPKLVSLFVPGAGFISAILSIYDTVKVFIEKLARMVAVVKAFVDSIVAIAAGDIKGAASRVESALAGLLSLAISFLAGFLGLGNIASKVMDVVKKVQAAVDKALDTAITWIVTRAKALFAKLFGGKDDKPTAAGQLDPFEAPLDMAGTGHGLSVHVVQGRPRLVMASGEPVDLGQTLTKLLNSADPKVKAKLAIKDVRAQLAAIQTQVETMNKFTYDHMEELYIQNEAHNPQTVKMVVATRGAIIQELREIGSKYGIKSLTDLGHPSKYVLDDKIKSEFPIRQTFYNVKWDGAAEEHKNSQMAQLRDVAQQKQPWIANLPEVQKRKYYWSEDKTRKVTPPAVVNVEDNNGSPELDHVEPLGIRWASMGKPKPGNNTVQNDRNKDYVDTANLQVIAKWMNLKKGGESFAPQVGPDFRGPDE